MATKTCSRKYSDMTPCVVTDGADCYSSDGFCVGCGASRQEIEAEESAVYADIDRGMSQELLEKDKEIERLTYLVDTARSWRDSEIERLRTELEKLGAMPSPNYNVAHIVKSILEGSTP